MRHSHPRPLAAREERNKSRKSCPTRAKSGLSLPMTCRIPSARNARIRRRPGSARTAVRDRPRRGGGIPKVTLGDAHWHVAQASGLRSADLPRLRHVAETPDFCGSRVRSGYCAHAARMNPGAKVTPHQKRRFGVNRVSTWRLTPGRLASSRGAPGASGAGRRIAVRPPCGAAPAGRAGRRVRGFRARYGCAASPPWRALRGSSRASLRRSARASIYPCDG